MWIRTFLVLAVLVGCSCAGKHQAMPRPRFQCPTREVEGKD